MGTQKLQGMDFRGRSLAGEPHRLDSYMQQRVRLSNGKYAIVYYGIGLRPTVRVGNQIWGDPHISETIGRADIECLIQAAI